MSRDTHLDAYWQINTPLKSAVLEFLDGISGAWSWTVAGNGQLVSIQSNFDVFELEPRKLKEGCDGRRVRILTKIHSTCTELRGGVSYGRTGERGTVRYAPWPEDVVRGFVGVVFGEILSYVLLGEGPFETSERFWVDHIVRVAWFAWWVVRHSPVRRGWGGVW